MRRARTMLQHEIINQSTVAMQGLRSHPRMWRQKIILLDFRHQTLKAANEQAFIERPKEFAHTFFVISSRKTPECDRSEQLGTIAPIE